MNLLDTATYLAPSFVNMRKQYQIDLNFPHFRIISYLFALFREHFIFIIYQFRLYESEFEKPYKCFKSQFRYCSIK